MDDDLTGLDEALRASLAPGGTLSNGHTTVCPLWNGGDRDGCAGLRLAADVPGYGLGRRRRHRTLRVVSAAAVVLIAVGLVLSQVLVAPTSSPARRSRQADGTRATHRVAPASDAECEPEDATARPCGVLSAAAARPAGSGQHPVAPVGRLPAIPATSRTAPTAIAASNARSRVLDIGTDQTVSVVLPTSALWAHPIVAVSERPGSPGPVVAVRAPPVTRTTADHGWERFVVEGIARGTATLEVRGSCAAGASCGDGHTRFLLEVHVGAT